LKNFFNPDNSPALLLNPALQFQKPAVIALKLDRLFLIEKVA
jgi:hypothetical protein